MFENNAKHMVLYRLIDDDDTLAGSTVADRSITDLIPALADIYGNFSKTIEAIYARLNNDSVNAKPDTL